MAKRTGLIKVIARKDYRIRLMTAKMPNFPTKGGQIIVYDFTGK